jgi:hypothetical protein
MLIEIDDKGNVSHQRPRYPTVAGVDGFRISMDSLI